MIAFTTITARAALELAGYEGIVREWYLDNATPPAGTWGIGVTDASGHDVDRYKDNPQPIERVLEIYVWLLRTRYAPDVLKAFAGYPLTEAEFAAALSWHYNTGAILKTDWVGMVKKGAATTARKFFESHYLNSGALKGRRQLEAELFFDGRWAHENGLVPVYPVLKPSYKPDFRHPQMVDVRADMAKAVAA